MGRPRAAGHGASWSSRPTSMPTANASRSRPRCGPRCWRQWALDPGEEVEPASSAVAVAPRGSSLAAEGELTLEDGTVVGRVDAVPRDAPFGYHRLRLDDGAEQVLITGPGRCHLPRGPSRLGLDRPARRDALAALVGHRRPARPGGARPMVGIGRRRLPRGQPAERSESGPVPGGEPLLPEHAPLRQPAPPVHRGAARCRGRRRPCRAGHALNEEPRVDRARVLEVKRAALERLWARGRVRPRRLRHVARRAGGSAGSMGDVLRPERAVRAGLEALAGGLSPAVGAWRRRGSRTRSTNGSRSTPGCSGASIGSSPTRRATCAGSPTCPSASTRPASTPGTGRSSSPSARPSACRPIGSTPPARTGACHRSRRIGFARRLPALHRDDPGAAAACGRAAHRPRPRPVSPVVDPRRLRIDAGRLRPPADR